MIIYHRTSLLKSTSQTVVNTVNCVGVMGKGLAAAFKKQYPEMFERYKNICDQKLLEVGKLWLWKGPDQWVLNFPTKKHWRSPSRIEWIEAGLQKFVDHYERQGIKEIAFPKLGCGNGNLDWDDVRPLMESYLDPLPINVFIHDHEVNMGLPEHIEALIDSGMSRPAPTTFDEVWSTLLSVSDKVGDRMIDFESRCPFRLKATDSGLILDTEGSATEFTQEEIFEAWRILASGILTKRKLDVPAPDHASKLISIFSLMPSVRPVPIQLMKAEHAEIAAEVVYRNSPTETPASDSQLSLSWH